MSVANYKHMKLNMGKKLGTVFKKSGNDYNEYLLLKEANYRILGKFFCQFFSSVCSVSAQVSFFIFYFFVPTTACYQLLQFKLFSFFNKSLFL